MNRSRGGALLLAVLGAAAAIGAEAPQASYRPPRLWDGTTPDLRGIWQVREAIDLNIEGQPGGKGVAATRSIIVDPADGRIPYRPEALAKRAENSRQAAEADPSGKCMQPGVPRATWRRAPLQILQSPGQIAIVYQDTHAYRVLYPSSMSHFEGVDWWMGDSRSHWEGDTLVVSVTTLNDHTWFDAAGNHHTNAMKVLERYTPLDRNTLRYEARIEDPQTFTRPWTVRTTLHRDTRPGARILEDECLEDVNGVRRRIAPSDPRNLLVNNYRRWDIIAQLKAGNAVAMPPASAAVAATPAPAATATPPAATAPTPAVPAAAKSAKPIPRLPSGKPDFRGTWYKSGGLGLTGNVTPGGVSQGGGGLQNEDTGRTAARSAVTTFYKRGVRIPYNDAAVQEKKWRSANQFLDGEPRCHLAGVPRAAEQPPYPHYILQDENSVAILYEYVHEPRIVPMDGRPFSRNYRAWDGESRGHWEGDTLVIESRNFNGRSWLDMSGHFVDENLRVVERYTYRDGDTYWYEATLTNPGIFSEPWTMAFEVNRQKDSEVLLEYGCLEGESDLQHYTEETGGLKADAGAAQVQATHPLPADPAGTVHGCLRGELAKGAVEYTLDMESGRPVKVAPASGLAAQLPELIDREVRLTGQWRAGGGARRSFEATAARPLAEGCSANIPSR